MGKIRKSPDLFINIVRHLILYGAVVICLVPYGWTFVSSIKPLKDILTIPPVVIFKPTFEHYVTIVRDDAFLTCLRQTLVLAICSSLLGVSVGTLAGYGLSRFRFRGQETLAYGIFAMRFIPYVTVILPLFLVLRDLGLLGTTLGLVLALQIIHVPFITWLMRSFFVGIPTAYEEAGMIDGLSRWGAFFRVVLPLAVPALASALILSIIFSWNQYMIPLMLSGKNVEPLTVGLTRYSGGLEYGPRWALLSAWSSAAVTPVIVLSIVIRKYIVGVFGE